MTHAPTAVGLIPFVPSGSDFDKALAFFAEFGFATEWRDGPIAGLKFGAARILLQDIDIPDWQKNQMLTLEVDDLDGFWQHLENRDLEQRFAGVRVKPPQDYPWGREVHVIDPAGVCWHVRQART